VRETSGEMNLYHALRSWVRRSLPFGIPEKDSNWNPAAILQNVETTPGAGFLCDEFAAVFVGACFAAGLQARMIKLQSADGRGHYAAEVWSDTLQQWVFMDPLYDFDCCAGTHCLSALDLHNRAAGRNVPVPGSLILPEPPTQAYWDLFHDVQVVMANDFFSRPLDSGFDIVSGSVWTYRWTDETVPLFNRKAMAVDIILHYYCPKILGVVVLPYYGLPFAAVIAICAWRLCIVVSMRRI